MSRITLLRNYCIESLIADELVAQRLGPPLEGFDYRGLVFCFIEVGSYISLVLPVFQGAIN